MLNCKEKLINYLIESGFSMEDITETLKGIKLIEKNGEVIYKNDDI